METASSSTDVRVTEAWTRFRSGDFTSRNTLVEAYLPIVQSAAERMFTRLAGQVELVDLANSGALGLMEALESFDPGRGVKFETYCAPRIRGAMLDELRSMDWVPRLVRSRQRKIAEAVQAVQMVHGRKPTEQELGVRLGLSPEEVHRVLRHGAVVGHVSLEHRMKRSDYEVDCRLGDLLEDRRDKDPARIALRQDLRELILRGLTRAERLLILLYYFEGMTMLEIGHVLDITESRVSQMHAGLLKRMRESLEGRRTLTGEVV
jgi:RNA polymerase sigma factor FliA